MVGIGGPLLGQHATRRCMVCVADKKLKTRGEMPRDHAGLLSNGEHIASAIKHDQHRIYSAHGPQWLLVASIAAAASHVAFGHCIVRNTYA